MSDASDPVEDDNGPVCSVCGCKLDADALACDRDICFECYGDQQD